MSKSVKRQYELELSLGADDFESLIRALDQIMFDLHGREEQNEINIVSGGHEKRFRGLR